MACQKYPLGSSSTATLHKNPHELQHVSSNGAQSRNTRNSTHARNATHDVPITGTTVCATPAISPVTIAHDEC